MPTQPSLWAILLAGGEGTRLRGQVIAGERIDRPKQFLRFHGDKSLLGATLTRALRLTASSRVVPVVSGEHREWWTTELRCIPQENILVQPLNRGTAVAILHALVHILRRDTDPTIVVLPCDHGFDDESPVTPALLRAAQAANRDHRDLVLLGVRPEHPEIQYGWILPESGAHRTAPRVRSFVEKPPHEIAAALMKQGALWNTLMFAVSGAVLLETYASATPWLAKSYLWRMTNDGWADDALAEFYRSVPTLDFGRDILQPSRKRLRAVSVDGSGWTDLGTPERVEAWLDRRRGMKVGRPETGTALAVSSSAVLGPSGGGS